MTLWFITTYLIQDSIISWLLEWNGWKNKKGFDFFFCCCCFLRELISDQPSHNRGHDSVVSDPLRPHGLYTYSPWDSLDQNIGVGSLFLLQGIFPTQGSNPGLPHWRRILYQLSHKGSPRILEWVAYPFSGGSSRPRNWIRVSCIASGFFTKELLGKPIMENMSRQKM